jgi:DNA-binding MarR family transcriptional regulator
VNCQGWPKLIAASGASGIADALENAGLATRHRQLFNRRSVYLELTSTGRALISKALQ